MSRKAKPEMISPKAFAELHDVAYTTVMFWLKNELIAGVERAPLPFGKNLFMYQIPADAPRPDIKPGPKPEKADASQPTKKAAKKSAKKSAKKGE